MISRRLKTDNRLTHVVASLAVATLLAGSAPAGSLAGSGDTKFQLRGKTLRVSDVAVHQPLSAKGSGLSACGVPGPKSDSQYSSRGDREANFDGLSDVCVFFGFGDDAGSDDAPGFNHDFDFDPEAHRGLSRVNGECDD
jgi:hypothetical protein